MELVLTFLEHFFILHALLVVFSLFLLISDVGRGLVPWNFRLIGELIGYVRRPQSSNIFFSETAWPIKVNGGTKVCSNNPGHMAKMAAMSKYGKNLLTPIDRCC